jgi:5-oxoprolinase (ATP-hydrolysing) subunit A
MNRPERTVDLNSDLGEGCPWDEPLLARVTSASISCGAHAGDRESILRTLRAAKARGVVVGAHPGYADREGFGRREQKMTAQEVERLVREQLDSFTLLAKEAGATVRYVKPHGALYNQAQREEAIAQGVVAAIAPRGLPILGQPKSCIEAIATHAGVRFIAEGFADRRYRADGRLVPRTEPNAILDDPREIEEQVIRLVDEGLATLCIHGDDPRAVALADRVLAILKKAAIATRSFI